MKAQVTTSGLPELGRKLSRLELQALPTATYRAVNRTATHVRSEAVKDIARDMGSRQKDVRGHSRIYRASKHHLSASIVFDGKALNLAAFRARRTSAGVSSAPWRNRRVYLHAFITEIRGNRLVMIRKKRGGQLVSRMPIRAMLGPSVPSTAAGQELVHAREDAVRRTLPVYIEQQLQYEVEKLRERGR